MFLHANSGLSGLSAVCGGAAASVPTAPTGAVFAAVAHPSCCRSDAACTVPCGDGDAIRWWRELVTGTWYEQATSGFRPVLRASGGKWYAELDKASGRFFRWGTLSTPAEMCVAVRSPYAVWDNYGGFLNSRTATPYNYSGRWLVTESGNTTTHTNPPATAAWKDGASVASPFNLAPITAWMRIQARPSPQGWTGDVLLAAIDMIDYALSLHFAAGAAFGSARSAGEQAADLAWLAEYMP